MSAESIDSSEKTDNTSDYLYNGEGKRHINRDSYFLEKLDSNILPTVNSKNDTGVDNRASKQEKIYSEIVNSYSESGSELRYSHEQVNRPKIDTSMSREISTTKSSYNTSSSGNNSKSIRANSNSSFENIEKSKIKSWRRSSNGTISTAMLLNFEKSDSSGDHSGYRNDSYGHTPTSPNSNKRTSSFYPPLNEQNGVYSPKGMIKHKYDKSYRSSDSKPSLLLNSDLSLDNMQTQGDAEIDKAVKQLQVEMGVGSTIPNPFVNNPFFPNEYKIKKRISISANDSTNSSNRSLKNRRTSSLLSNRLIPSDHEQGEQAEATSPQIPALRSFSATMKWNATPPIQFSSVHEETFHNDTDLNAIKKELSQENKDKIENNANDMTDTNTDIVKEANNVEAINENQKEQQKPEPARLGYAVENFNDDQINSLISKLNQFKNQQVENDIDDIEKQAKREYGLPSQRVDSNSISSFDSQESKFWDIYSINRLLLLLLCCTIIPPLFFMIGLGERAGVSDYRLMRLVMHSNHRLELLKGFIWDVDINWLRKTSLIIGIIESCIIFAMIGVGFGVGIRND